MRKKGGDPRQPAETLRKNLRSLFNSIYYWANPAGVQPIGAFLEMPTIAEAPNYNSLINQPICFNMIDNRLKGGHYWSETDLLTEIMLMFANCRLYNQEAAQVYQDADTLEKVLLTRAEQLGLKIPPKPAIGLVSKVKAKEFARARKAARVKEVAGAKIERGSKATKAETAAEEVAAGELLAADLEREVREFGSQEVERRKRRRNRAASKSLPASKRALMAEAKELEVEAKLIGVPQSDVESPRSIRRSSLAPAKGSLQEKIKELYIYIKEYTDPSCRILSLPFMKLPSKSDYPDYYAVIKQPMDLQMISRNRRRYETLDEAVSDFTLVFDNAMRYNDDESLIYKDAKTLERAARHWRLDMESGSADSRESPSSSKASPPVGPLEQHIRELYTFLKEYKDHEGRPLAFPFMKLPSKSEYPDYYEVIPIPMDLQMIFRNRRRYESLEDAIMHFKLVFDNAMKYNIEESQIYKDAQELERATQNWRPTIKKDFIGTLQLPRMCG